jgi:dihydrofolate reductase
MHVAIFAAVAENGVIGRDNGLPWRLSSDLKRFKAVTMGKPVIMGRKTWEGLPRRPLPGRLNIVVTRDSNFGSDEAIVAHSLGEALARAEAWAREEAGVDETCVIGGGEIYRQAMALADRLYITHVLAKPDGDTLFPAIDPAIWEQVSAEDHPAGEKDSHAMRFAVYARKQQPSIDA